MAVAVTDGRELPRFHMSVDDHSMLLQVTRKRLGHAWSMKRWNRDICWRKTAWKSFRKILEEFATVYEYMRLNEAKFWRLSCNIAFGEDVAYQ